MGELTNEFENRVATCNTMLCGFLFSLDLLINPSSIHWGIILTIWLLLFFGFNIMRMVDDN